MEAVLSTGATAVEIVTQLIQTALSRSARDNITAVLARYQGE
jgi:serine/threonine protein phosphatase PrpC